MGRVRNAHRGRGDRTVTRRGAYPGDRPKVLLDLADLPVEAPHARTPAPPALPLPPPPPRSPRPPGGRLRRAGRGEAPQAQARGPAREGRGCAAARVGGRPRVAQRRTRQHVWPHHRHRGEPQAPERGLDRPRHRRPAAHDQPRRHLRAPVHRPARELHRLGGGEPVGPEPGVGRDGRGEPAQLRVLRQRGLPLDGRRRDLGPRGPRGGLPDRRGDHPPRRPQHRLCRRPRPPVGSERGARPLQDHRRWRELGQGPGGGRRHGGRRDRHAPGRSRGAAGRHLRARA